MFLLRIESSSIPDHIKLGVLRVNIIANPCFVLTAPTLVILKCAANRDRLAQTVELPLRVTTVPSLVAVQIARAIIIPSRRNALSINSKKKC